MLKKMFLLLFIFFISSKCSSQGFSDEELFNKYAQDWLENHIINDQKECLDADSLKIIANLLGISYELAHYQSEVLKETQGLLNNSWNIYESDLKHQNNIDNLQKLQNKIENLKNLFNARKVALELNDQIQASIDSTDNIQLKNAIDALFHNIQLAVNESLLNEKDNLEAHMSNASNNLANSVQSLHILDGTYQALINGDYPFQAIPGFEFLFKTNESVEIARLAAENSWLSLKNNNDYIFESYQLISNKTQQAISSFYQILSKLIEKDFDSKKLFIISKLVIIQENNQ